jgi:hypothetical protein
VRLASNRRAMAGRCRTMKLATPSSVP